MILVDRQTTETDKQSKETRNTQRHRQLAVSMCGRRRQTERQRNRDRQTDCMILVDRQTLARYTETQTARCQQVRPTQTDRQRDRQTETDRLAA